MIKADRDRADWLQARDASGEELGLTRRGSVTALLAAFTTVALTAEVAHAAPARRMAARTWIERQGELARALKAGQVTPRGWMDEVVRLAAEIEVAQLMAEVNRARVTASGMPPTNDPRKRYVRFLDARGEPRRMGYGAALFDFAPHNVITPHGHRHMASSHLIVSGRLRIRNFDRLRDVDGAMVIRPTRDVVAGVGALSAMSSQRDNIHWFVPSGGPATTFDVIISSLDAGKPDHEIKAIDPLGGRRLADGSIVAPLMGFMEASRKYTARL